MLKIPPEIKPAMPSDWGSEVIKALQVSRIYFGEGGLTVTEMDDAFATATALKSMLENNCLLLGMPAEKIFEPESTPTTEKIFGGDVEVSRSTTCTINIVGLTNDKKDWLETVSREGRIMTLIGVTDDYTEAVIINGKVWNVKWNGKSGELSKITLTTTFSGATANSIRYYHGLAIS